MRIPLEDQFQDVIGKARRGLKLSESGLAQRAGVELEQVEALQAGELDEAAAIKVAAALDLHAPALLDLARGSWEPDEAEAPATFAMYTTEFGDMTVNAYLVWDEDGGRAAAFDTGADCTGMLETLQAHGLTLESILLTHTHPDHIAALGRLVRETGAAVYVPAGESAPDARKIEEGARFTLGGLTISARQTPGHSPGGMTYVVEGLAGDATLGIVGDALFAGSMGGVPPERYAAALQANREKILSLPDEAILCPGHGPLTTVGEEKAHNPFYPK